MNPDTCMHTAVRIEDPEFVCRLCGQHFPRFSSPEDAIESMRRRLRHEEDPHEAPER